MELTDRDSILREPAAPVHEGAALGRPDPGPGTRATARAHHPARVTCPARCARLRGCVFHTRCPIAIDECRERIPEWRNVGTADKEHWVWCHRVDQISEQRQTTGMASTT